MRSSVERSGVEPTPSDPLAVVDSGWPEAGAAGWDLEPHRARYRLCRAGFAFNGLGLGLIALDSALHLAFLTTRSFDLLQLLNGPFWQWVVGSSITWTTQVGSYLLWGRWNVPAWQRRAG